jgi:carbon-monoxide dehydrogenase medium subunit
VTPFTFLQPSALPDALKMLGDYGSQAKLLAGGQSLLLELKTRAARPAYIISLASLPDMKGSRLDAEGRLEVGSSTTYAQLSTADFPGWQAEITSVAGNLADRSVRNMGTIGGAACQADPRFDVPTLLVAVDAQLAIASLAGLRHVAAQDFFNPKGGTRLGPNEILTSVRFPSLSSYTACAFEKFRVRVFDAAIVSAVAALKTDDSGQIEVARLTVGAVGKAPLLATYASALLHGMHFSHVDAKIVAAQCADELIPHTAATSHHLRYQRELVLTLVEKSLRRAIKQISPEN